MEYTSQINELVKKKTKKFESDEYYLSGYFPVGNYSKSDYQIRLKSFLMAGLRKHDEIFGSTILHEKIVDQVWVASQDYDASTKGLGIFIDFNKKENK